MVESRTPRSARLTASAARCALVVALVATAVAPSLVSASTAGARSRSGSGWEPGTSSDTVTGRVGKKKATSPSRSGAKRKPVAKCTSRTCRTRKPARPSDGGSAEAMKLVRLPPPSILASPSVAGLIGVTTYLVAVLPPQVEFDLAIDGVSTHLTARPVRLVWDVGDGRVIDGRTEPVEPPAQSLPGIGTALDFTAPGNYGISALVDWSVTWSTSDGDEGSIDDRRSNARLDYQVRERRSVLVGL